MPQARLILAEGTFSLQEPRGKITKVVGFHGKFRDLIPGLDELSRFAGSIKVSDLKKDVVEKFYTHLN